MATSGIALRILSGLTRLTRFRSDRLQLEFCATNIGESYFSRIQDVLQMVSGADLTRIDQRTVLYRPPAGHDNIYQRFVLVITAVPDGERLTSAASKLIEIITNWLRRQDATYREIYIFGPDRTLLRAVRFRDGQVEDQMLASTPHVREFWPAYEGRASEGDPFTHLLAHSPAFHD